MTYGELLEFLKDQQEDILSSPVIALIDTFHYVEIAVTPTSVVFVPVMDDEDGE